ncbi:hypothetical protein EYC84_002363 [Monilinia fructicola]|uniref:CFEM domain-containing protein n=1 Tax=Monilinia fructicola TaxID=38448 RepID=A0A5M9JQE6_MONFR|nr:hypothetical protein EYC84_002363 [Monilinia fructicola]
MKFSILSLAAAATLVSAVEFAGQPACASPCISQAISQGTNCNIEDIGCQCDPANLAGISTAVIPCIVTACTGAGELQQASEAGPSQCSIFSAQGATTAGTTSTSSAESTSESSSASPASTTSSGPTSTTSSGTASTTSSGATSTSTSGTETGTVTRLLPPLRLLGRRREPRLLPPLPSLATKRLRRVHPQSTTASEVTQNAAQSVGLGVGAMLGLVAGMVAAL